MLSGVTCVTPTTCIRTDNRKLFFLFHLLFTRGMEKVALVPQMRDERLSMKTAYQETAP